MHGRADGLHCKGQKTSKTCHYLWTCTKNQAIIKALQATDTLSYTMCAKNDTFAAVKFYQISPGFPYKSDTEIYRVILHAARCTL